MNKLIAKTAFITAVILVALSVIWISLAALFSPAKFAKAATGLGMYRTGANFQEIAYTRRPNTENLGTLIDYAVAGKSNKHLVKYCPKIMEASDYASYCAYRDGAVNDGAITGAYAQYVCGSYALALYRTEKKEEALSAIRLTVNDAYPANNAVQYLLYEVIEREDVRVAQDLASYLNNLYLFLAQECPQTPSSEMQDIAKDQCIIFTLLLEEDPENMYYIDQMRLWVSRI
ncbi:MAG: hypothetical protein II368_00805 [Clostridia bacterium]|jgi:hypothetical protein|nr:hypothetical protein [Clostridia bacterium]MBQ5801896.1 hypothetical protein [Clostridia bacterium]